MGSNAVQSQRGLPMAEFMQRYGTQAQCHAVLVASRWPQGFVCPGLQRHATQHVRAQGSSLLAVLGLPRADHRHGFYERTIDSLYPLPVKQHLYYLFDNGDCWIFKIAKVKLVKEQPDPRLMYPRIVSEAGNPHEQYPTTEE